MPLVRTDLARGKPPEYRHVEVKKGNWSFGNGVAQYA